MSETPHYLHLVEKKIDERNKPSSSENYFTGVEKMIVPSCEEQIAELSAELSELANVYMDQYVHFKDMVFDILEGKLSIEDAKIQMHGLERGYDK